MTILLTTISALSTVSMTIVDFMDHHFWGVVFVILTCVWIIFGEMGGGK